MSYIWIELKKKNSAMSSSLVLHSRVQQDYKTTKVTKNKSAKKLILGKNGNKPTNKNQTNKEKRKDTKFSSYKKKKERDQNKS